MARPYPTTVPPAPPGIIAGSDYVAAAETGVQVCEATSEYRPRRPEEDPLYGSITAHLETLLEMQFERERVVSRFVERKLKVFLGAACRATGFCVCTARPAPALKEESQYRHFAQIQSLQGQNPIDCPDSGHIFY